MNNPQEQYKKGVQAIRSGNIKQGSLLLKSYLIENPNDANAWIWLTKTVDSLKDKQKYVARALMIQPDHTKALELKQKWGVQTTQAPTGGQNANQGLGPQVKSFSANVDEPLGYALGGVFILGVIGAVAYFFGDDFAFITESNKLLLAIGGLGLAIVYTFFKAIWVAGQKLTIYQNGFEHKHFGRRHWLWKDITRLEIRARNVETRMQGFKINTSEEVDMRIYSGKKRVFKITKTFKDVEKLCDMLCIYSEIEPEWI